MRTVHFARNPFPAGCFVAHAAAAAVCASTMYRAGVAQLRANTPLAGVSAQMMLEALCELRRLTYACYAKRKPTRT